MDSDARPRRSLGQHFLVDRSTAARIVARLAPRPGEALLEIGPGRGALTEPLLEAAGRLAVVEIDTGLAARLRARWPADRLVLFAGDVLDLSFAAVLEALGYAADAPLVVAGNLPYNISKPVVQKLVRERRRVERAALMFQREVAARLVATPGGRDWGPLGILAGAAFTIEIVISVPPGAFRPQPKVQSAVTLWRRRPDAPDDASLARLRRCLATCFARRRRTLWNNLRAALGEDGATALLREAGIDGVRRPETLTRDELFTLAKGDVFQTGVSGTTMDDAPER